MTTYRVLLSHPLEPRLLMLQTHGEWRLPHWEDSTEHEWRATDHVNRAVAARYGAETTVLRCAHERVDATTGERERVYELENHSPAHDMPLAATWISQGDLAQMRIESAEVRELVQEWFTRTMGGTPLRGAPWTQHGWYVQALAWATARLSERGITVERAPEQRRAWERGFVMALRSDAGTFIFRAVPRSARHAPALEEWLRERFPESIPEVIAVDRRRGWYLQREVAGVSLPLEEAREELLWEDAVRRLAEIQVATVGHTADLRALGVPDRTLDVLAARIPALVADGAAMLLGSECGLTRPQLEQVAKLGPDLVELCRELAALPVPAALEHGDLPSRNILVSIGGPVFHDWASASISHPFFSLFQLVRDATELLAETSTESSRRLREIYLQPWQRFAAREELLRAFEIARVLAPLHLAATTHAELLPAAGWPWEVECDVPRNLRPVLELLQPQET